MLHGIESSYTCFEDSHTSFSNILYIFSGNDPTDEDVDIGGNEPPVSSYPPMEIEKDAGHRISKSISSDSTSGKSFLLCSVLSLPAGGFCFPFSPGIPFLMLELPT